MAAVASACVSEPWGCGMGAACPALADVAGVRYGVSGAVDLPGIEEHLVAFAAVSDTNMDGALAEMTAYKVEGVDPLVLLVVRSRVSADEPGAFRELWSLADDPFPSEFCMYMTGARRAAQSECQQS